MRYCSFLQLFKPSFKIWLFTYRPSSAYNFDKHFVEYPASVIDTIFGRKLDGFSYKNDYFFQRFQWKFSVSISLKIFS